MLHERLALWLEEIGANGGEVYDLSLATSEAFINAIEHPHEPTVDMIDVRGSISDHTISVTIQDSGSWRQEPRREEGGYGFPMMRTLMDTVDVETRTDGTSITLRLRIDGNS
jgi:anti-sigma regulatory factor (Ser/Thr protein kinase)